ncbi:MAG: Do family serine endopeptidase [Hyphomonadaceae bacterium]|nr:Do family serine endopeptidase [Hyphomonadaceae bacterium]
MLRIARPLCLAALLALVPFGAGAQSLSDHAEAVDMSDAPESFSELAKRLMPAVVNITTRQTVAPRGLPEFPEGSPLERFNPFFGRDEEGYRQEGSLGSGFVISADGLVITNNHVIENADEITAVFSDGTELQAELIGTDPETDVAVLRLISSDPLPYVEFADSESTEVGDWVMAIGNPFGFGGSVSAGIISARNRNTGGRYDDFLQTDAAINRGNSGGPLFNLAGEVVGVNTAIISPTGGSVGIGFAIPSNMVRRVADQLVEFGELRRGWLGVSVQGIDADIARAYGVDSASGVIITRVEEDGPAAEAGLEVGDLIRTFNGEDVSDTRALTRIVADAGVDVAVDVELVRDRRTRMLEVTLGELDTGRDEPEIEEIPELSITDNALGVEFVTLDETTRRRYGIPSDILGVVVNSVSPRGPSFGKLEKGDVILEMGFDPVSSVADAVEEMEEANTRPETPLLIQVWRGGRGGYKVFFSIQLDATS